MVLNYVAWMTGRTDIGCEGIKGKVDYRDASAA